MSALEVIDADLSREDHQAATLELLDAYARDPMGKGAALPAAVRGRGIGRRLLDAVAEKGRAEGCCRLTLEVQENNRRARRLYESVGLAQAAYEPEAGGALFMSKTL